MNHNNQRILNRRLNRSRTNKVRKHHISFGANEREGAPGVREEAFVEQFGVEGGDREVITTGRGGGKERGEN